MPKIVAPVEEKTVASVAAKVVANAPETKVTVSEEPEIVLLTESSLKEIDVEELEQISFLFELDVRSAAGRNTAAKFIRAILVEQSRRIQAKIPNPDGLANYASPTGKKAEQQSIGVIGEVNYNIRFTKQLAPYQTLAVEVGVTLPLVPSDEDIANARNTMEIARNLCDEKLQEDLGILEAEYSKRVM